MFLPSTYCVPGMSGPGDNSHPQAPALMKLMLINSLVNKMELKPSSTP